MGKNNDHMDFFIKVACLRHLQKQQYKLRFKKYKKEISAEKADQQLEEIAAKLGTITRMVDDKIEYGLDYLSDELLDEAELDDVVRWTIDDAVKLHQWKVEHGYVEGHDKQ